MRNLIVKLFLTTILIGVIKGTVVPRFDIRDKDGIIFYPMIARAGQVLIAECNVVALTPENIKSVSWKLNRLNDGKEFYLATNNNVFQFVRPTQRLFAYHNVNSKKWLLKFAPLDRDDIGNLTCFLADTGATQVTLTRPLDVHSEPIILESSSKDVDVSQGSNVDLKCNAQGFPKPAIFWLRADGKTLSDGANIHRSDHLRLRNVTERDRGVYKCIATNLISSGAEWTVKVSVRFPPKVKCQTSVGQAPNFEVDAYMECYVYSYPAPRLIWYKQLDLKNPKALTQLTESYKYKFEATIPEPEVCTDCILARITVINIISADYGMYVLRASSEEYFDSFSEGKVKLYETPECQQSITNPNNRGCRTPPKIN